MAVLNTQKRNNLPSSSFAIPEKKAYPIFDATHARNALARVSANGTPAEQKRVKSAVKKKFPQIDQGGMAKKGSKKK